MRKLSYIDKQTGISIGTQIIDPVSKFLNIYTYIEAISLTRGFM
jgi:hypothetical protein